MGRSEWSMLLFLSALWGSSFFFFRILALEMPPFTVVLGRVGLAALILHLVLLWRKQGLIFADMPWGSLMIMGLLNNVVPFTLIVVGETRISSGLASILNATTPVFAVLAAHAFTNDEKLNWNKASGVILGFTGLLVLIGPSVWHDALTDDLTGQICCLIAAVSYAFAAIYGRRFSTMPPMRIAAGQLTASTLMLLPVVLVVDQPWTLAMPSTHAWAAWIAIASFSTALAYTIYFRLLATAGATNLMLVTFLLPVSALLLGGFYLGETVTVRAITGMLIIGMGLAAIDGRLWMKIPFPSKQPQ